MESFSQWTKDHRLAMAMGLGSAIRRPSSTRRVVAGGLIGLVLGLLVVGTVNLISFGTCVAGASIGFFSIREERTRKRRQLLKQFPDFLELFALGLSSGLNFEQAWVLALTQLPAGRLSDLLQESLSAISLGQSRTEALSQLSGKLTHNKLSAVLSLVIQAISRGSPLQTILIEQAERLRTSILLECERHAQTASIRLLFPIVFLIFPTLFIILFAPLVLRYLKNGSLF